VPVLIGPHHFDDVAWDPERDVLSLWKGPPRVGDAHWDYAGSPEGHALAFDERGELVHVELVSPRFLLDRDGRVPVSHPDTGEPIGDADVGDVVHRAQFGYADDPEAIEAIGGGARADPYIGADGRFDADAYERDHPRPGARVSG